MNITLTAWDDAEGPPFLLQACEAAGVATYRAESVAVALGHDSTSPVVVFYHPAHEIVRDFVSKGYSLTEAVSLWCTSAEDLLASCRKGRARITLVSQRVAQSLPSAFLTALGQRLAYSFSAFKDKLATSVPALSTEMALLDALARGALMNSAAARKLILKIDEMTLVILGSSDGDTSRFDEAARLMMELQSVSLTLATEVESLKTSLSAASEREARQIKENATQKVNLRDLRGAAQKAEENLAETQKELTGIKAEVDSLKTELSEASEREVLKNKEITAHAASLKDLRDAAQKAANSLVTTNEELADAKAEIDSLKTELTTTSEREVRQIQKIATREANIKDLRDAFQKLEGNLAAAHKQLSDAKAESATRSQFVSLLQTQLILTQEELERGAVTATEIKEAAAAKAEVASQSQLITLLQNQAALIQQKLDFAEVEVSANSAIHAKERQALLVELDAVRAGKRKLETKLLFVAGHLVATEIAMIHTSRSEEALDMASAQYPTAVVVASH